jgi:prefoldin subunit 5
MATPRKSTNNTKKDPTMNMPPKSFNFNEFNKYKELYKNIRQTQGVLEETKSKFQKTPDSANSCNNACTYLLSVLQAVFNHTNNSNDHKAIQSLYGDIYQKLIDFINNLNDDYENRAAILKTKLEDLDKQRQAYVDFELKGIEEVNNEPPESEWKHINDKDILNIIGKLFGFQKDPSSDRRMVIDENGIWFR